MGAAGVLGGSIGLLAVAALVLWWFCAHKRRGRGALAGSAAAEAQFSGNGSGSAETDKPAAQGGFAAGGALFSKGAEFVEIDGRRHWLDGGGAGAQPLAWGWRRCDDETGVWYASAEGEVALAPPLFRR